MLWKTPILHQCPAEGDLSCHLAQCSSFLNELYMGRSDRSSFRLRLLLRSHWLLPDLKDQLSPSKTLPAIAWPASPCHPPYRPTGVDFSTPMRCTPSRMLAILSAHGSLHSLLPPIYGSTAYVGAYRRHCPGPRRRTIGTLAHQ